MLYSETIKIILESLGRKDEIDYYLNRFRSEKSPFFCLIIPDYQTLIEYEVFMFKMEILYKLELKPIILINKLYNIKEEIIHKFYKKNKIFQIYEDRIPSQSIDRIPVVISTESFLMFFLKNKNHFPERIHFVRNSGPLRDQNYEVLYTIEPLKISINKNEHTTQLEAINNLPASLNEEDIGIYVLSSLIFNELKSPHISITSSFLLLKELFTVKGAGTLLRIPSRILHLEKSQIHPELSLKIKQIIEHSFQRKLKPYVLEKISDVYLDSEFQSLVLLEKYEFGYYLSKYAVSFEARGKGIALDLWNHLLSKNLPLFWRAKQKNSIWRWYQKISDGMLKKDLWYIFWKNIDINHLTKIIDFIYQREEDFYD